MDKGPQSCRTPSPFEVTADPFDDERTAYGLCEPGRGERAFGGHVAAQVLSAAALDVPADRHPDSLHVYFAQAASIRRTVDYRVRALRDGGQLSLRGVSAGQLPEEDGEPALVAEALCSFVTGRDSSEHQPGLPDVPPPDSLERVGHVVPSADATAARFFDLRPCPPASVQHPDTALPPRQLFWARLVDGPPRTALEVACALTYLADLGISHAADRPHVTEPGRRFGASLDHAVWFHRLGAALDAADSWWLVDQEGVSYADRRAFTRSQIQTADGRLLATATQESMIVRS